MTTSPARAVLFIALALGLAADMLLRDGPDGVGLSIWVALAALGLVAATRRAGKPVVSEARVWLAAATLFAAGLFLRGEDALQVMDLLVSAFCLGMAAVVLARDPVPSIYAARVRDLARAAVGVAADSVGGILALVTRDGAVRPVADDNRRRVWTYARAALIAVPVVVLFGALLISADPLFASWLSLPYLRPEVVLSHLFVIGFFSWTTAGWMRRAAVRPLFGVGATAPGEDPVFTLGVADITAVLGSLAVLFTLFLAAQIGWLFGGEHLLQQRTGLTVAQYARRGFFELVWVAMLVVPVLLATRVLATGDGTARRRHTQLGIPLIGLVFAMMASAVGRMSLYVSYFGLTVDRLTALAFMAWVAIVLVWLVFTVLRDRGLPFVGGAVAAGLGILALLNIADPDLLVARVNVSRAVAGPGSSPRQLDFDYLASLEDGALPLAVQAILDPAMRQVRADSVPDRERSSPCLGAQRLLRQWAPWTNHGPTGTAWRKWNVSEHRAREIVGSHARELLALSHTCRAARRPSTLIPTVSPPPNTGAAPRRDP